MEIYHLDWLQDMDINWRERSTSVWENHHYEKPSTSRFVVAKIDKNTKEKGAWIPTPPDKNSNIQKLFYEQISS